MAASATAGAVIAGIESNTSTSAIQRSVQGWQDEFVACANTVLTAAVLLSEPVQKCMLGVMTAAVEAGQLTELNEALAAQIELTPSLFNACHNIGHAAGQRAFEVDPDIEKLLLTQTNATCQYALGHGILDGFAKAEPTDAEFAAAAQACTSLADLGTPAFAFCSDGLGHAAWASTNDLASAVARCGMLGLEYSQAICSEGIIMQIYEPAGLPPARDINQAHEDLPEMCATWPSGGRASLDFGCHSGAGYIYTRPAWKLNVHWAASGSPATLDPGQRAEVIALMSVSVEQCLSHLGDGASHCLHSVSQQVPPMGLIEEQTREAICAPLGEWQQRCRTWQHTLE